ncbi:MAG: tRNA uridine-5-carboxymethylaminomethyl(34) synthesis enzyme MnmG [Clostridiales bacterium]|nr:tRNA uridine-5-carboxymethylaminomethyl(34) synthesis enzyme MnmG [Clostridiales bacterium]
MENRFTEGKFDAVVIGAGHAGCEAALALARTGFKTVMLTLNLDSIAFMACNPSIGGTAKGQIVKEIDALGGEMGINADRALLQIRMLNRGKGAAVQSLRGQADKNYYHTVMKKTLENTPNLKILQGEAVEILTDESGKNVSGVLTSFGGIIECKSVIVATGVYLNGSVIAGEWRQNSGPSGFQASNGGLTENLIKHGFTIRRFKTGTPARVDARTIDFSVLEVQDGEKEIYPFSFLTESVPQKQTPCYLTYTNEKTHQIIRDNLHRSPLYGGLIKGTGPRYCPSIEDKVVRFADKERHQLFLEPEGADTNEIYVQGLSTSLPHDVQKAMYRTIKGLENCEIMRYAYAIEYDCIDSLDLLPTLEYKKISGLYMAGQVNGTSGYEEAAAQGLIAGLNASLKMRGLDPLIISRDDGYIGVLIDDLVTKGTNEPYRMMTSRAEYRIVLRQDNPDFRLTEKGRSAGLVDDERYNRYLKRVAEYEKATSEMNILVKPKDADSLLKAHGYDSAKQGLTKGDLIRRGISLSEIIESLGGFDGISKEILDTVETDAKYQGYLQKGLEQIEKAKKLEEKSLPDDIDYLAIKGLRIEAQQKLDKIRPKNLGQAGRISGVSPADIAVLMVYLKK